MDSWGSSECDRVLNIFAMRQQGSEKTNDIQDDTNQRHEPEISHEKRKNLKEIRQILKYLAHKRMARLTRKNAGMLQAFTFTNTLEILELNDLVCIKSTSAINRNTECIGHIMKNVVGPRVVIFLAARNAIVLVARSDQITTTGKDCKLVWLGKPDCKLYLGTQLMNTGMYKIPQNPGFKASFCLISYHTPSNQRACSTRMRHLFSLVSQEPRIDTLTKRSS
ncbi:unnamed protein product [Albugo candida]|uniref:Uncharacterized protein n=1 Tax=Albugo candida TaxID=65357 RepID=A0A024FW88_9STRA|nr:unnamed protein product [Albugo candida]|eukprot:CCI11418.1 unnamed protein product [Albugo candida]